MHEHFLELSAQLLRIQEDDELRGDRRVRSVAAQAAVHAAECQKAGRLHWLGDYWTPEHFETCRQSAEGAHSWHANNGAMHCEKCGRKPQLDTPDAKIFAWHEAWVHACWALGNRLPNRLAFDFGGILNYQAAPVTFDPADGTIGLTLDRKGRPTAQKKSNGRLTATLVIFETSKRDWRQRAEHYAMACRLFAEAAAPTPPAGAPQTPHGDVWSAPESPGRWASLMFKVTLPTLNRWIKAGKVRVKKLSRNSWQVHSDDIPKKSAND